MRVCFQFILSHKTLPYHVCAHVYVECFLHMIWSWQQESVRLLGPWGVPMVYWTCGQFSSFYVSPLHSLPSSPSTPAHLTAQRPGDEVQSAEEDNPKKSKEQVTRSSAKGRRQLPQLWHPSGRWWEPRWFYTDHVYLFLTNIKSAVTVTWPLRGSCNMVGHGESEAIRGQSWKLYGGWATWVHSTAGYFLEEVQASREDGNRRYLIMPMGLAEGQQELWSRNNSRNQQHSEGR